MLQRIDNWMAHHRLGTAVALTVLFPAAVVSTGVALATALHGPGVLTAVASVLALGAWVAVGLGVRQATRRRDAPHRPGRSA